MTSHRETKYRNASDAELVLLVQSGQKEAFDEIDRRYRTLLYKFLLRYPNGAEYAEELCQQTLVKAYVVINQIQSGEKLSGWLHRIAFRLMAAQGRRCRTVSLENFDHWESLFPDANDHRNDDLGNIWQVVEKELSAEEFKILCLKYREDLSIAQIAEIVEKKETAVRVQLHRIRKKLYTVVGLKFLSSTR